MPMDRLAPEDVLYFDDTVGLLVFGGTELCPSFQGYIGQAVLYRHTVLTLDQVLVSQVNKSCELIFILKLGNGTHGDWE